MAARKLILIAPKPLIRHPIIYQISPAELAVNYIEGGINKLAPWAIFIKCLNTLILLPVLRIVVNVVVVPIENKRLVLSGIPKFWIQQVIGMSLAISVERIWIFRIGGRDSNLLVFVYKVVDIIAQMHNTKDFRSGSKISVCAEKSRINTGTGGNTYA